MKKTFTILLVILLISTVFPTAALANQDTINCYGGTVTITDANAFDFYYVFAPTTFVQTCNTSVPVSIVVNPGCDVTFNGDINLSSFTLGADNVWTPYPTLKFWSGDTTLTISAGSNVTIYGQKDFPAIQVQGDSTLTINGEGSLTARGAGGGAGIGEEKGAQSGNIIFDGSVDIEAYGGIDGGAGIGGGAKGACKSITTMSTYTGTITARGGAGNAADGGSINVGGGAGIGGGSAGGVAGNITMNGGNISAIAGSGGAAGIGSGVSANITGQIIIAGDTIVNAQGGQTNYSFSGAGIGAGAGGMINKIKITDTAEVTATGGFKCPGIGGRMGSIEISGDAKVDATGGIYGAGIGSGYMINSPIINISGGQIRAEAGTFNAASTSGAAIGGGTGGGTISGGINISGGEVIAIPHLEGAGIGAGSDVTINGSVISGIVHDINISGGVVYIDDSVYNSIGASDDTSQGVLNLSGEFALYLRHPITCTINKPDTKIRSRLAADFIDDISGGMLYGYKYICPKTPFIAYFNVEQLSFWVHEGAPEAPKFLWMKHGGTVTLPWADKSYNYNGYAVKSWSTDQAYGNWGPGTEYAPGSSYTLTESRTLYVNWKSTLNQYTVTYLADDNTNISGETTQTVTHGQNASSVTATAKPSCIFLKWSDDIETATRQDLNIKADATYTANGAVGDLIIEFHANNNYDDSLANMPSPIGVASGVPVNLPENIPTRDCWSFMYWNINTNAYYPGDSFTTTFSIPAYATWDCKPIVVNDSASLDEAGSVQIDVLANDYDEYDSTQELSIGRIVTQPQHGTVQTVNGKIEYTHNGDGATSDVFYYKLNDPYGESYAGGKVTVTITQTNDAPAVDNGIADQTVYEDTMFEFIIPSDAFSDEESSTLTYSIFGLPTCLSFDGTNGISGTPANADVGEYDIIVIATDGDGLDAQTTFKITVENVNDAPAILDQTYNVDENTGNGDFVAMINAHDVDAADSIVFEILSGNEDGAFEINTYIGEVTVKDSSLLNFETNPSFVLSVKVTDEAGASSSAAVTIDINDVNDKPSSKDETIAMIENEVYTLKESDFYFSDEDGDALAFVIILNPAVNGVIKLNGVPITADQQVTLADIQAGKLVYQPNKGVSGQGIDFFQYRVNDGTVDSFDIYGITFDITATHEITYLDYNGSTLGNEIVVDENSVSAPEEPAREGYTFVSWTDGQNSYKKDLSDYPAPKNDVAFMTEYEINQYTLKFENYDGSEIKALTLDYGSELSYPSDPERTGYTFVGWDSELIKMPANNTTVIAAQYRINKYTVSFLGQDGKVIESRKVSYKGKIEYPDDPQEDGYHFAGWSSILKTMPANDVTIESEWVKAVVSIEMQDSLSLTVGDKQMFVATITPDDAKYKTVEWSSSNTFVASVSKEGIVTGLSAGSAEITAEADGMSCSCVVEVTEKKQQASTSSGSLPVITTSATKENEAAGTVIVDVDVSKLPEGTTAIRTASGETIALDGSSSVRIEINADDIDSDGNYEITALGDEDVPLGSYNVFIDNATEQVLINTAKVGKEIPTYLLVIIIIVGAGLVGAAIFIALKIRKLNSTNKRNL